MKKVKQIDCFVQVAAIIAALAMAIISGEVLSEPFMAGYFIVGGLQVISVIGHFVYVRPKMSIARKVYLYLLLALIVFGLISLVADGVIIFLMVLLCISPLMAVFYLLLCYNETQKLISSDAIVVAATGADVTTIQDTDTTAGMNP
jgi:hypothetical protein